jgi:cytidine deaminase
MTIPTNCPLTEKEIKDMIKIAKETRKNAFSYRSMHKIWASVLTIDGKIFGWCNVESAISWLGTCAERCAVDNAVSHGKYDFKAVCALDSHLTPVCWACLQYILLFSQVSDQEVWIINADIRWNYEIRSLTELLPEWYRTKSNLESIRSYSKIKKKK